jgi:N-carbamoyl-L-amino-acid hydrolase
MTPAVNQQRLFDELTQLATFTEPAAEGAAKAGDTAVTRVVFTERDREARTYLAELAEAAGLTIRTDAIGNTFYRWQGSAPDLPAVATGSHVDAIPNAGMYDGTVGVLGGLEAIRALQAAGFQPRRSIELILFTSEEPTRFGIGCLGSRLMSGALSAEAATKLGDKQDRCVDEVRAAAGCAGPLASTLLAYGHYEAFVELHIEQGPLLETASLPIGIVTAIAAPSAATITIDGFGGHAGALLMPQRRDALAAAAEVVLAVEAAALATGAIDTVATVGLCDVFPGAVNSVPSRVRLSLDARDIDLARRDSMLVQIEGAGREIATRRNVTIAFETLNADAPATCGAAVIDAIEQACASTGTSSMKMISRAYHDSLFMARICPVAMIFIPSRGGVSHRPDEYSSPEQIAAGTSILAATLATLSLR